MSDSCIDSRIERIAKALDTLVGRLRQHGYVFARPEAVLPGPDPSVDSTIERIKTEIGVVPYSIAAFWRRIGSVDLGGSHGDWFGCEYPDPLVIEPAAYAVAELDEFLGDRVERIRCNFPYAIPISGDEYHKEEESGGMWYNLSCPATTDDPIVNDERHHITFLNYLELALKWGGFLGLERSLDHNWPIHDLAAAAV
jgi:hypothetical protein